MLEFDNIHAWVLVDGRAAAERRVRTSKGSRTVVECYIESIIGQTVELHWEDTSQNRRCHLASFVFLDNISDQGPIIPRSLDRKRKRDARAVYDRVLFQVGDVQDSFAFCPIAFGEARITDDPMCENAKIDNQGEIEIQLFRVVDHQGDLEHVQCEPDVREAMWRPREYLVHKRFGKQGMHCLHFGQDIGNPSRQVCEYECEEPLPFLTFLFKYRPNGAAEVESNSEDSEESGDYASDSDASLAADSIVNGFLPSRDSPKRTASTPFLSYTDGASVTPPTGSSVSRTASTSSLRSSQPGRRTSAGFRPRDSVTTISEQPEDRRTWHDYTPSPVLGLSDILEFPSAFDEPDVDATGSSLSNFRSPLVMPASSSAVAEEETMAVDTDVQAPDEVRTASDPSNLLHTVNVRSPMNVPAFRPTPNSQPPVHLRAPVAGDGFGRVNMAAVMPSAQLLPATKGLSLTDRPSLGHDVPPHHASRDPPSPVSLTSYGPFNLSASISARSTSSAVKHGALSHSRQSFSNSASQGPENNHSSWSLARHEPSGQLASLAPTFPAAAGPPIVTVPSSMGHESMRGVSPSFVRSSISPPALGMDSVGLPSGTINKRHPRPSSSAPSASLLLGASTRSSSTANAIAQPHRRADSPIEFNPGPDIEILEVPPPSQANSLRRLPTLVVAGKRPAPVDGSDSDIELIEHPYQGTTSSVRQRKRVKIESGQSSLSSHVVKVEPVDRKPKIEPTDSTSARGASSSQRVEAKPLKEEDWKLAELAERMLANPAADEGTKAAANQWIKALFTSH